MKRILIAIHLAALCAWAAYAQTVTSTQYALTATAFTDLGFAPATVQVTSGTANVVIADTTPAITNNVPTLGMQIGFNGASGAPVIIGAADAYSHVFATSVGQAASITVTPNLNPLLRWRVSCHCFVISP